MTTEEGVVVRTIHSPEVVPVDLLEVGGSPILKRLAPLRRDRLVLVLVVLVRRRRSARGSADRP